MELTENFVKNFYEEKQNVLRSYFEDDQSAVASKLKELNLSENQLSTMKDIIDDVLTDTIYTMLLGLGGSASIGNSQIQYKIYDENNNKIEGDDIEEYAWSYFQDK